MLVELRTIVIEFFLTILFSFLVSAEYCTYQVMLLSNISSLDKLLALLIDTLALLSCTSIRESTSMMSMHRIYLIT